MRQSVTGVDDVDAAAAVDIFNFVTVSVLKRYSGVLIEFQPFKRSYSQLTFFNFFKIVLLTLAASRGVTDLYPS